MSFIWSSGTCSKWIQLSFAYCILAIRILWGHVLSTVRSLCLYSTNNGGARQVWVRLAPSRLQVQTLWATWQRQLTSYTHDITGHDRCSACFWLLEEHYGNIQPQRPFHLLFKMRNMSWEDRLQRISHLERCKLAWDYSDDMKKKRWKNGYKSSELHLSDGESHRQPVSIRHKVNSIRPSAQDAYDYYFQKE